MSFSQKRGIYLLYVRALLLLSTSTNIAFFSFIALPTEIIFNYSIPIKQKFQEAKW